MNGAPGEPCTGFPTGVENKGGSSKFNGEGGGGLSQYMRGAWGGRGGASNAVEKYM